jgi:cellulose synthase/poly-beta-1,6-N-acetylglucosamine synthase-like glycosyltransferase
MPVTELLPFAHGIFYVALQSVLVTGLFLEGWRERKVLSLAGRREAGESRILPAGGGGPSPPRVSVVVPVHNEEGRLPALLEDLAAQDYRGAEIILVDDRSEDGTGALLSRFARDRAHVRILTLEENPGPNRKQYALGKALEEAAGELFLFTDADCRLSPGWIGAMVERMEDPRTGAVIAPVFRQWRAGGEAGKVPPAGKRRIAGGEVSSGITRPTIMWFVLCTSRGPWAWGPRGAALETT